MHATRTVFESYVLFNHASCTVMCIHPDITVELSLGSPHKTVEPKPDTWAGDVVWTGVSDAAVCVYHCNTEPALNAGLVIRIPRHEHSHPHNTHLNKKSDADRQRDEHTNPCHTHIHTSTGSFNYPDTLTSSLEAIRQHLVTLLHTD